MKILDSIGKLLDYVMTVGYSVWVDDIHMFYSLPVLLDVLSQNVLPSYCVRYKHDVYVYDKLGKTVCIITPSGVLGCSLDAGEVLGSLADKYYTLGVLILVNTPSEARATNAYLWLADEVERLAAMGATLDIKLYSILQELLDHVKTRVYGVFMDKAQLHRILEEMDELSNYEAVSGYTQEGEPKVIKFYVHRRSMELVYRGAPISMTAKLQGSEPHLITYTTYYSKPPNTPVWYLQPELCQDIDAGRLKSLVTEWREIALRALQNIMRDEHHQAITRLAKLWLDILSNIGSVEKELP